MGTVYGTLYSTSKNKEEIKEAHDDFDEARKILFVNREEISNTLAYNKCLGLLYNNMGSVFLLESDMADSIEEKQAKREEALKSYIKALEFSTPETNLTSFLHIKLNIGNIYSRLYQSTEKEVYANDAIDTFKQALAVVSPDDYPIDQSMINVSLAKVYLFTFIFSGSKDNLTEAERYLKKAQELLGKEEKDTIKKYYPYASILQNRALLDICLSIYDTKKKKEHLIDSIAKYKDSLSIFTASRYMSNYSVSEYNTGSLYYNLYTHSKDINYLKKAIDSYYSLLKVCTEETSRILSEEQLERIESRCYEYVRVCKKQSFFGCDYIRALFMIGLVQRNLGIMRHDDIGLRNSILSFQETIEQHNILEKKIKDDRLTVAIIHKIIGDTYYQMYRIAMNRLSKANKADSTGTPVLCIEYLRNAHNSYCEASAFYNQYNLLSHIDDMDNKEIYTKYLYRRHSNISNRVN